MLRTTLAGLRAHKLRLVATALAIVLGVGFVTGTLIFGDTAKAALYDEFARSARNVDVVVQGSSDLLPLSTSDTARGVPGVRAVEGRLASPLPMLDRKGRPILDSGSPGAGVATGTVPGLLEYDVTRGRAPAAAGEAAIDVNTAKKTGYRIGDTVTVLDRERNKRPLTVVGVVDFGTAQQYSSTSVVVLGRADLIAMTGVKGYRALVVSAAPGVSQRELADRVAAALPNQGRTITGDKWSHDLADDTLGHVDDFVLVFQLFAWIAVIVSAFVIYNTFNILIAQRMREAALLRCVGGSRGQLFGSVLIEAVVVGVIGAAVGIGAGLAVAYGLFSGAGLLGMALPEHALVLTPTPALVALIVGVAVTVVSAFIPAVRATRVAPLAALRTLPMTRIGTVRGRVALIVLAVLIGAGGTALTFYGSSMPGKEEGVMAVLAGGIVNFLAVLVLSPLFVGPVTAAVGWLPGKLFGTPARLASANARRNPGRAAATTAALMIGVGLMAASSVLIASTKATAAAEILENYPADYVLSPVPLDSGEEPSSEERRVPSAVADRLRADRTFSGVARVREAEGTVDGTMTMSVAAVDPAGMGVAKQKVVSGSLANLKPGAAAMERKQAKNVNKKVGDQITIAHPDDPAKKRTFTLVAIYEDTVELGFTMVHWDDLGLLYTGADDSVVLAKVADGIPPTVSRDRLDTLLAPYPMVQVGSLADWREEITGALDQLIGIVAALLGFAIVIALIGIMNTLYLSVFERTRESAMVRALGLTRGQLRGTLVVEALLMGVVGAVVGTAFGVAYGWITTPVLFDDTALVMRVPVPQLLGYVALAGAAGVVAAVLPARRAAKASIVSAMAET